MAGFQGISSREEFLGEERIGTTKLGLAADFDESCHSAYVIVVPVSRYDEINPLRRVYSDALEILQGTRLSLSVDAGVDDHPATVARMEDDALPVAGAKQHNLNLILVGGSYRSVGFSHRLKAARILRAHSSPSRRSDSVIAGRSRNTIWETRFFVPPVRS